MERPETHCANQIRLQVVRRSVARDADSLAFADPKLQGDKSLVLEVQGGGVVHDLLLVVQREQTQRDVPGYQHEDDG